MKLNIVKNIAMEGIKPMEAIAKLRLRKGRPNIVTGRNAAGKSQFCAWLACGVAGAPHPLIAPSERGKRVVLLDLEQEKEDIVASYSRILNGLLGEDPNDIHSLVSDNLILLQERGNYFENNRDELKQYCMNAGLLIIDNLSKIRNSLGQSIDENSQDMGKIMDMLKDLSTETNCPILLIHHNGRTGHDRGSSTIGDGAGQMFQITNFKGKFAMEWINNRHNAPLSKLEYSLSDDGIQGQYYSNELRFINVVESYSSFSGSLDDSIMELLGQKGYLCKDDIKSMLRKSGVKFANNEIAGTINRLILEGKINNKKDKTDGKTRAVELFGIDAN